MGGAPGRGRICGYRIFAQDSDIDVAVIVPTYGDRKFDIAQALWHDVDEVSLLIEPVLMAEDRWSPLYKDVMRTGVVV